jgi:hypothetical protein
VGEGAEVEYSRTGWATLGSEEAERVERRSAMGERVAGSE